MTESQIKLLKDNGIKVDDKVVVWEDRDVLEVKSRRGRRFVISKKKERK